MSDYWGNPSYEEIVGTPEDVVADGHYPTHVPPLKRLKALCLLHMRVEQVGVPFRWMDEQVRLDDEVAVSYMLWGRLRFRDQVVRFYCPVCKRRTLHAPKGEQEVNRD